MDYRKKSRGEGDRGYRREHEGGGDGADRRSSWRNNIGRNRSNNSEGFGRDAERRPARRWDSDETPRRNNGFRRSDDDRRPMRAANPNGRPSPRFDRNRNNDNRRDNDNRHRDSRFTSRVDYRKNPYERKRFMADNLFDNEQEDIEMLQPAAAPATPAATPDTSKMRLNRYIANSGVCSRRNADTLIKEGKIMLNGVVVTEMGIIVQPGDEVRYEGRVLTAEKKIYVLLNKPKDTVTTTDDPEARRTVMDLVKNACAERIYPVGRLDRNTTGVLLLTNDGELASKLTHPKFECRKIYHVFADKPIASHDIAQMYEGLTLDDGPIAVDDVRYVDPNDKKQVGVEIHSGRNRIVRRIFESLGYEVERLDRVYFAGLTKLNLPRGHWRFLTQSEVNKLKAGFFK